jgi:hypothetical protein
MGDILLLRQSVATTAMADAGFARLVLVEKRCPGFTSIHANNNSSSSDQANRAARTHIIRLSPALCALRSTRGSTVLCLGPRLHSVFLVASSSFSPHGWENRCRLLRHRPPTIGSGIHPVLLLCVSSIRSSSSYITSILFPPVELLHADQAHSRRSSPPVLSTSVPLSPYHTSP